KQQLGDTVVLLAGAQGGKVALVAGVNGSATGRVKAGELLAHVAGRIGGKGGGRPDLAQGGGEDGPALAPALADVPSWVAERIGVTVGWRVVWPRACRSAGWAVRSSDPDAAHRMRAASPEASRRHWKIGRCRRHGERQC